MDVSTASAQVADYIRSAIEHVTGGQDPTDALASAQADTGITTDAFESADMGQSLDFLCAADGLPPQYDAYFGAVSQSYASSGSVAVGGGSAAGASAGASAGAGAAAGASSAAAASASASTIVNNYPTYIENTYNENDYDFNDVNGDISIDTDQSNTEVDGDGAVVTTGDGDVNAATGDGSSAATSVHGDAQSNTGDGAVQNTGVIDGAVNTGDGAVLADGSITAPVNTGEFTGVQTEGAVQGVAVGNGNTVVGDDADNLISGNDNTATQIDGGVYDSAVTANGDATNYNLENAQIDESGISFGSGDVVSVADNDGSSVVLGDGSTGGDVVDVDSTITNASDVQVDGIGDQSAGDYTDNTVVDLPEESVIAYEAPVTVPEAPAETVHEG